MYDPIPQIKHSYDDVAKPSSPRLLAVFAHPDDESLAAGGLLAHFASLGFETHLLVATSGEAGWKRTPRPRPQIIAQHRKAELCAAAQVLRVKTVRLLGLPDGSVASVSAGRVVGAIAAHIAELRPETVLTFGPEGLTGHPDHIAISGHTSAAVLEAMRGERPHHVGTLWHLGIVAREHTAYERLIGPLAWMRSSPPRRPTPWKPWMVTAEVNTRPFVPTVREAVLCHHSQLRDPDALRSAPLSAWEAAFGRAYLYRALALNPQSVVAREMPSSSSLWPQLDKTPLQKLTHASSP